MNPSIEIHDKETGKTYFDLETLAHDLYKEGWDIVPMDIETLAQSYDTHEWYLLDECGNHIHLSPKRFEVRT